MKICSLLPSGTEILYALGLGDQIIGVTDLCLYPPEVREKPVVCRSRIDVDSMTSQQVEAMMRRILEAGESPYELDGDWIASNSPDVVLTQDLCYFCEVDAQTVGRTVDQMPMPPEVVILNPRTLQGILDSIVQVGESCGVRDRACALVSGMEERVQAVEGTLTSVVARPRVFSLEGINPLVIGGHWIPDLLLKAGGAMDAFTPGCAATRLPWEDVVSYAPEKLFVDLSAAKVGDTVADGTGWMEHGSRSPIRRGLSYRSRLLQRSGAAHSAGVGNPRPVDPSGCLLRLDTGRCCVETGCFKNCRGCAGQYR